MLRSIWLNRMKMPALLSRMTIAVFALCFVAPHTAIAKLSGPAPSFATLTADGKHLFVMLSQVPVGQDQGNDYTLPNGSKIRLRDRFASSGLYPVDSSVPHWTVAWYGDEGMVQLSEDGRYVVRINRFGGGGYGEGVSLKWGVKFYDSGREVASYHVRDLVDDPSLMIFTSDDWHYLWIGDSKLEGHSFALWTTTHERYRFDVETGEILESHRLWNKVHLGVRLLCIVSAAMGLFWVRNQRSRRLQEDAAFFTGSEHGTRLTFGCRALLAGITLLAALCGLVRMAPQRAVFLMGACMTGLSTFYLFRKQRTPHTRRRWSRQLYRATVWIWVLTTWALLYILSLGPVLGIIDRLNWPHDCRQFVVTTVYAPLWWLSQHHPAFDSRPIKWYVDAWR